MLYLRWQPLHPSGNNRNGGTDVGDMPLVAAPTPKWKWCVCVWVGGVLVCVRVLCPRMQPLHPIGNSGSVGNGGNDGCVMHELADTTPKQKWWKQLKLFFLEASFQHLGVINKTKDECWAVANDYVQTFLVKY